MGKIENKSGLRKYLQEWYTAWRDDSAIWRLFKLEIRLLVSRITNPTANFLYSAVVFVIGRRYRVVTVTRPGRRAPVLMYVPQYRTLLCPLWRRVLSHRQPDSRGPLPCEYTQRSGALLAITNDGARRGVLVHE